jgi:hypothetical protein
MELVINFTALDGVRPDDFTVAVVKFSQAIIRYHIIFR